MSTQVGDNTLTSSYFYDANSNHQFWTNYTMPSPGGVVTDLYAYVGGYNAATTGQLVLWSGGNVLWSSSSMTFPQGSQAGGGQSWLHASVPSVFLAGGTSISIGFWAAGAIIRTSGNAGGTAYAQTGVSSPSTQSGGSVSGTSDLAAYLLYTPSEGYVNTGTSASPVWTAAPVYVNTGTPASPVWTAVSGLQVWNGSAWVNAG